MKLGVNIDHVATLRQARRGNFPDPVAAAMVVSKSGADNVTCHLREDRRHVQDRDALRIRETCPLPMNFEMAATDEMVAFAIRLAPQTVTLVPERREEITTEGGLDVVAGEARIHRAVNELRAAGIEEISLFVDPDERSIEASAKLGAHAVELHTGRYAHVPGGDPRELEKLRDAARWAKSAGMAAHAGHGLDYGNVGALGGMGLDSLQIGHAIVAEAVFIGLGEAVSRMKRLIDRLAS